MHEGPSFCAPMHSAQGKVPVFVFPGSCLLLKQRDRTVGQRYLAGQARYQVTVLARPIELRKKLAPIEGTFGDHITWS